MTSFRTLTLTALALPLVLSSASACSKNNDIKIDARESGNEDDCEDGDDCPEEEDGVGGADGAGNDNDNDDPTQRGCDEGFADCNGDSSDGCEVDLNGDDGNCGACGFTCSDDNATSVSCELGVCTPSCSEGFDDCSSPTDSDDGCESDLSLEDNCGVCGRDCQGGTCALGRCAPITLSTSQTTDDEWEDLQVNNEYVVFRGDHYDGDDFTSCSLYRIKTTGEDQIAEKLETLYSPDALDTVELDDQQIYWDSPTHIMRRPLDGSVSSPLVELSGIRSLLVNDESLYVMASGTLSQLPKLGGDLTELGTPSGTTWGTFAFAGESLFLGGSPPQLFSEQEGFELVPSGDETALGHVNSYGRFDVGESRVFWSSGSSIFSRPIAGGEVHEYPVPPAYSFVLSVAAHGDSLVFATSNGLYLLKEEGTFEALYEEGGVVHGSPAVHGQAAYWTEYWLDGFEYTYRVRKIGLAPASQQ